MRGYLEKTVLSRNRRKPIDLTCFGLPFDRKQTPRIDKTMGKRRTR